MTESINQKYNKNEFCATQMRAEPVSVETASRQPTRNTTCARDPALEGTKCRAIFIGRLLFEFR